MDLIDLPTVALDEVRDGDLIFTARPGRLQQLVELAGDPWRHVGVAATVDGQMSCCEVAGHSFQFRPLDRITRPPHTAVGLARFPAGPGDCGSAAARWATSMLTENNLYAWDDLILTGVLLAVRRRVPATLFPEVMAVIQAAEALAREAPPPEDRRSFTCASFVYHAFAQAGVVCKPQVTIETVRSRPPRPRGDDRESPPTLAELVAEAERGNLEALVGPLERYTLLELSGAPEPRTTPRTRVSATSRMDTTQFVATVRNLVRIFATVRTDALPSHLVVDERWVSPGDLWRLDNLELRALLPIAETQPTG